MVGGWARKELGVHLASTNLFGLMSLWGRRPDSHLISVAGLRTPPAVSGPSLTAARKPKGSPLCSPNIYWLFREHQLTSENPPYMSVCTHTLTCTHTMHAHIHVSLPRATTRAQNTWASVALLSAVISHSSLHGTRTYVLIFYNAQGSREVSLCIRKKPVSPWVLLSKSIFQTDFFSVVATALKAHMQRMNQLFSSLPTSYFQSSWLAGSNLYCSKASMIPIFISQEIRK